MKIEGPDRYDLSYDENNFTLVDAARGNRFLGIAASIQPKLYVASIAGKPIYIGITKQKLQKRLTYGWKAVGANGYHGYKWKNEGNTATLDVWVHLDAEGRNQRDIETVEAEVVYLIRNKTNQWPAFQTEIHFYPSTDVHRGIAEQICGHYRL